MNILVSGGNRGRGLELVNQYSETGWRVYAACRRPQEAAGLHELGRARPNVSIHLRYDGTEMPW